LLFLYFTPLITHNRNKPMKRSSISIIIPALNEEGNIQGSIDDATYAAKKHFDDYEIIVVNDGSTDNTLEIVNRNIKANNKIKVISHLEPQGFGASYNTGRRNARMKYCIMVQGDNPFSKDTLQNFFSYTTKADIICGYIENVDFRPKSRQVISSLYTRLLNWIFKLDLRYYNGPQIHQTAWLKGLALRNSGFGFQAEVLIKAIRDGKSWFEVPVVYTERAGGGATKIFKLKNVLSVINTIFRLMKIKDK